MKLLRYWAPVFRDEGLVECVRSDAGFGLARASGRTGRHESAINGSHCIRVHL
jgi:hypothetical protein